MAGGTEVATPNPFAEIKEPVQVQVGPGESSRKANYHKESESFEERVKNGPKLFFSRCFQGLTSKFCLKRIHFSSICAPFCAALGTIPALHPGSPCTPHSQFPLPAGRYQMMPYSKRNQFLADIWGSGNRPLGLLVFGKFRPVLYHNTDDLCVASSQVADIWFAVPPGGCAAGWRKSKQTLSGVCSQG